MKRLRLRFQNYNGKILTFAFISVVTGIASGMAFSAGEIAGGIILAIVYAGAFTALIWYVSRVGVILDFRNNRLKMKSGSDKEECALDEITKMEIVFHRMRNMSGYSAQVKVNLKNGRTITVKFYPKRTKARSGYTVTGEVSNQKKLRIENKVSGYGFISCRTIEKK